MSHTIVVVEDQPLISNMICKALQHAFNVVVERFEGTRAARQFLETCVPSLVITDMGHLDGTGKDLVDYIRGNERLRAVPIIVQSGQLFDAGFDPALFENRIDAALAKPWTMRTFLKVVARCLGENGAESTADAALIRVGAESKSLDYKKTVDLDDKKQRACIAKDVIAFSNSGGGSIVIGVDEDVGGKFAPVGLTDAEVESLEVTRLNDVLRRYIGTEVSVRSRRVEIDGKAFVVIFVPPLQGRLAFAREEHPEAALYPGRIYVRNDAAQSVEVRDAITLSEQIERLVHERTRAGSPSAR